MAVVAPMAEWRPFSGKSQMPLNAAVICVHTMVGTLDGSWSWANRPGNSYWHFGLGGGGRLLQCQDLRYRSAANLEGNPYVIPIETADKEFMFPTWSGSDVPAWTPVQIDKLVELIAWLCRTYSIPPVLVPDSKPGRRGLAYHRQGIDPWRVPGGDLWSKSTGKVCPGDRRIHQFKTVVVPRVQAAVQEDDMPTLDEVGDEVERRLTAFAGKRWVTKDQVPGALTLSEVVGRYNSVGFPKLMAEVAAIKAQVAALASAVGQLGAGGSVDYARVRAEAEAAVKGVLGKLDEG